MITLLIAILIVLLSSAICSGSEAALFSVSIVRVKNLHKEGKRGSRALLNIKEKMARPIAAIVVLNNIANIVGSIVVGGLAAEVLGSNWMGLFSGLLTFFVIIFSEIIPKTIGEKNAESISLIVAKPIYILSILLTPILWIIEKITFPITGKESQKFSTNESEIKLLASIGGKEGFIEKNESSLINKVFELNNTTAKMLMTPRTVLTYLDANKTLEQVKPDIIKSEHSRILVINNTPDETIGVAMKNDLLIGFVEGNQTSIIKEFAKPVQKIKEDETAEKLLKRFQRSKQHLGVVVDDYGGVSGVVTLEDVIEILTGEIVDETDREIDLQKFAKQKKSKE